MPWATSSAICSSCGVSCSAAVSARRPEARPVARSSARALRPRPGTEPFERVECLLQRWARLRPLLGPPQPLAERQQRASPLEGHREVVVQLQRRVEARAEVHVGREQPVAARGGRPRPERPRALRAGLEARERRGGVLAAARTHVGLDEVGRRLDDRRLHLDPLHRALGGLERRDRLRHASERQLERAERSVQVSGDLLALEAGDELEPLAHVAAGVLLLAMAASTRASAASECESSGSWPVSSASSTDSAAFGPGGRPAAHAEVEVRARRKRVDQRPHGTRAAGRLDEMVEDPAGALPALDPDRRVSGHPDHLGDGERIPLEQVRLAGAQHRVALGDVAEREHAGHHVRDRRLEEHRRGAARVP
jgi:hypothetical protein